ncbi:sugar translocase [Diaphorobacter sp. HDW4A]|uniref:DUF7024 domain-containing protein n=1 Tax=Diaphorobacter sp. HDW4A TaxID=2714924 RepID=UPI00140E6DC1|nr:sugar translocase [Diaphorobacter sp. HDW4A]QIL81642.1 sugar translocase [Diaphorobacter sp. HDW4A]
MSSQHIFVLDRPQSLLHCLRVEWAWWLPFSFAVLALAYWLVSGFTYGIMDNLSYPYIYDGDGLFYLWGAQREIEGGIFEGVRNGYPFGSSILDYPIPDAGNILLLSFFGSLVRDPFIAFNLFFLVSFPVVFVSSFVVLRVFGLKLSLAICGSIIFTFLPFHFQRISHSFYIWYFVVPLYFYVCFRIFFLKYPLSDRGCFQLKHVLLVLAFALILSSFGVYYTLFGCILLSVTALAGLVKHGRLQCIVPSLVGIVLVLGGGLINSSSNIIHRIESGPNPEKAVRSPMEAEVYGLKFMQLILPRADHRIDSFANVTKYYDLTRPLVNENSTSTLGIIGAAGFLLTFLGLVAVVVGRKIDERISFLILMTLILFLFGTVGGGGSLFSTVVTPLIRGWNRISVFIAFGSIAIFFLVVQIVVAEYFSTKRFGVVLIAVSFVFGFLGLYDQTARLCSECRDTLKSNFDSDRKFIKKIEQSLPLKSAIYQLPYTGFPEDSPRYRAGPFDLVIGFLHSRSLQWSFGGMKGREGDLFYRALAKEPLNRQIDVTGRMGFSGIYVDRKGFQDGALKLISDLKSNKKIDSVIESEDGRLIFFRFANKLDVDFSMLSAREIMKKVDYIVDKNGPRFPSTLVDGIDFSNPLLPSFVEEINGLSGVENWGRWSDADLSQSVKIRFVTFLPRKFTLGMSVQPFGVEGKQEFIVRIGLEEHRVVLGRGSEQLALDFSLGADLVDTIEFIPLNPISPKLLGLSGDNRKLGIGFMKLEFKL